MARVICEAVLGSTNEALWRSGCMDPHFLVASFKHRPLCRRRKSPRYPLDMRRSGRRGGSEALDPGTPCRVREARRTLVVRLKSRVVLRRAQRNLHGTQTASVV
jgi:hypothetical protein